MLWNGLRNPLLRFWTKNLDQLTISSVENAMWNSAPFYSLFGLFNNLILFSRIDQGKHYRGNNNNNIYTEERLLSHGQALSHTMNGLIYIKLS